MTQESAPIRRPRHVPAMPGLTTLLNYRRTWLRGDFIAGCTVAAYLVPQVMAYATIAGLPPVAGLWGILPPMVIYAFFGSSRRLSVGPESTTALMTAAVVGPLAAGDSGRYAALAAGLAIMVGLLCLAFWIIRLGFVADLLSRPVLIGYMAGIAVIMVVGQLERFTGVPTTGDYFVAEVGSFVENVGQIKLSTVLMGGGALLFLFLLHWRWSRAPGALLAVILATAAVFAFDLEERGIKVVGEMPSGLPHPVLPDLAQFAALLLPALGVVLVGYTDNVLTARAFATNGQIDVDANQELLALGGSNIGAGLIGGFPISSSASRTALAVAARCNSQLYSLFAVGWTLAALFVLGPLLARFPTAVLGAIVIFAAVKLIDLAGFVGLGRFRRSELLLALVAFIGVLVFGILYGVLVAVGLSVIDMLRRVARPHDAVEGIVPGLAGMHDVADFPTAREVPGLVVYRYDSPLFFANAEDFRRRALITVDRESTPVKWFVLNMEANVTVDITALAAVEAVRDHLVRSGIVFALARVKQDLLVELESFGLADSVGSDFIFPTLPTAVAAYHDWVASGGTGHDASS